MSTDSNPLQRLLSMPLDERITAILADVCTKRDEFRAIKPHALATALGVNDSRQPSTANLWGFISYAGMRSLEEYASENDEISELASLIESEVSEKRFQILVEKFSDLDPDDGDFSFLTKGERKLIEEALAQQQLELNMENGVSSIARRHITSDDGELAFEAAIEDDGACLTLRTPYDCRDGKFLCLDDCVTKTW